MRGERSEEGREIGQAIHDPGRNPGGAGDLAAAATRRIF